MNANPHTHQVEIRRQWESSGSGGWRINYGDTTVRMFNWCHFLNKDKALRRKVAKAIRLHDRGSLRAQAGIDRIASLQEEANQHLVTAKPAWGSDLLSKS